MTPPIIAIVGRSNSGKTTLMEKLVHNLTTRGLRIATIKHSHHQPSMDTPGKDSWRHKQAGATRSFLIGPQQMLMMCDTPQETSPQAIAARYCSGFDLVLVEGYAALPGEKIEVVRAVRSSKPRCSADALIALVSDIDGLYPDLPRFALNDVNSIAAFICNRINR